MSKQVLSVEQMQQLQELGLELKPTMLYYFHWKLLPENQWDLYFPTCNIEEYNTYYEFIPAYTLQDILDVLPKVVIIADDADIRNECWLEIGLDDEKHWYITYRNCNDCTVCPCDKELIDAAYELLCWAIENGHVETNKNEINNGEN